MTLRLTHFISFRRSWWESPNLLQVPFSLFIIHVPSEIMARGRIYSFSRPISVAQSGWVKITGSNGSSPQLNHLYIHVQSHLSALAERVDAMAADCLGLKKAVEPRHQRSRKIVILEPTFLIKKSGPCGEPKNRNPKRNQNQVYQVLNMDLSHQRL